MIESVQDPVDRTGRQKARLGTLGSRLARSRWRAGMVALLGASLAAGYAHFVGCRTGTCPLTSNVWIAAAFGAVVGAVVGWPSRER